MPATEASDSPCPATTSRRGATVRNHTGRGTTKAGHLYLRSGRPIWNNDGDTATLIDPPNIAVSRYRY
jgi:hypothetical protein